MIQECDGGHGGGGDWEDPMASIRADSLEMAVDILSAHASDAGKLTPEEIGQGTLTVAKSFESYLSGGSFLPMEPVPEGPLY